MKTLFNKFLENFKFDIDTFHPYYKEAYEYILNSGGKRFRPLLLLNLVNSVNPLLVKNSLDIALAIEAFHTYSLIHDDLPSMDNASFRRGKETLHKKYDEVTAILVGDGLNTFSFELISNSKLSSDTKIELVKSLSKNGGISGMVLGQALDCYFENQKITNDNLYDIHKRKTAMLIASSLEMGAIILSLDKEDIKKLYNFGIELGILFQIQDDILDVISSDKELGKPTNNDINKNTFVNQFGLEKAKNIANEKKEYIHTFLDNKLYQGLKEFLLPYLNRIEF